MTTDGFNSDSEYRNRMDVPMEMLGVALWQPTFVYRGTDAEMVEIAARKIKLLKQMILSTGFNENLLNSIMEDI